MTKPNAIYVIDLNAGLDGKDTKWYARDEQEAQDVVAYFRKAYDNPYMEVEYRELPLLPASEVAAMRAGLKKYELIVTKWGEVRFSRLVPEFQFEAEADKPKFYGDGYEMGVYLWAESLWDAKDKAVEIMRNSK